MLVQTAGLLPELPPQEPGRTQNSLGKLISSAYLGYAQYPGSTVEGRKAEGGAMGQSQLLHQHPTGCSNQEANTVTSQRPVI